MADKKKNKKELAEEQAKELELKKQQKEEEKLLKEKVKEKERLKKEKEKRLKIKEKKEIKRIKQIINLPFSFLIRFSLLITLFSSIILFFGRDNTMLDTVYYSFIIFSLCYFGGGAVMVSIFYVISEDKIKELEEQRLKKEEERSNERLKEQEEFQKLVEAEKEFAKKRIEVKNEHRKQLGSDDMMDSDTELPDSLPGLEYDDADDDEELKAMMEREMGRYDDKKQDVDNSGEINTDMSSQFGDSTNTQNQLESSPVAEKPKAAIKDFDLEGFEFQFSTDQEAVPIELGK